MYVVYNVIRGLIGFDGFLLMDDVFMNVLLGLFGDRMWKVLEVGCDVVVYGLG